MVSRHSPRLYFSNAHPDRHPDRPHAVRSDARGGGDYQDASAAYRAGDYQKAFRLFVPLAVQGDVAAQFIVGGIYDKGKGDPEDHAKAVRWYTKAAKQGHARAQFNLGASCAQGEGVNEDGARVYAWFNIIAAQGDARGKKAKDFLAKLMTPAQIAEGQNLSHELWEKFVVPFRKNNTR